jgi:hypothetical protein
MENKISQFLKACIFFCLMSFLCFSAYASHITGGEMSYQCLGGNVYKLSFKVYRDCQGIPICMCPGMNGCTLTNIQVTGLDAGCGNMPTSISMKIDSNTVSGYDVVQLCRGTKTICTNCGTRSPGSMYGGVEVYTFTGRVDLSQITPTSCCNIALGWTECCRSAVNTNLQNPSGLSYYIGATINRCAEPCNNAPIFMNKPIIMMCAGQEFTYNLGAYDPDGDSLSYAFGKSMISPTTPAPYLAPYSFDTLPFPFLGSPNRNLPAPLGLHLNENTGDLIFTPLGSFVSNLVIEVTQWKFRPNGIAYKVGTTNRDIQFLSKNDCPPNDPLKFITYTDQGDLISNTQVINPKPTPIPTNYVPKTNWAFNVNENKCFLIEALDGVEVIDTTDLAILIPPSLSNASNGIATIEPTYPRLTYMDSDEHIGIQKYDRWKFCWTPTMDAFNNAHKRPYFFTVEAKDRSCPVPARAARSFAIWVHSSADSTSSIKDVNAEEIKLYPNPSNNQSFLELKELANWKIEISDVNGKQVRSYKTFKGKELNILKDELKTGLYMVTVKNLDTHNTYLLKLMFE